MRLFCACVLFLGLAGIGNALASGQCSPAPLPPKEERTDDFWKGYLKENLTNCYGELHPQINASVIGIEPTDWISSNWCPLTCAIIMSRPFLDSTDEPYEILFVLGHEAGHIALSGRDFAHAIGLEEVEYAADLIAVQAIPSGACHGARALQWIYDAASKSKALPPEARQKVLEEIRQRRKALLAKCAVDAVLVK